MRRLAGCAAVLAAMCLAFAGSLGCGGGTDEPDCDGHEVGDEWPDPDGCNTCTCTDDGIACTLMECLDACEDGHAPGETWTAADGCNSCICSTDLEIVCTHKTCPGKTCADGHKEGETWDAGDGCNTCTCTEELTIACTLKECPPETCNDGHLPGETWEADDGCNTCTCTEDLQIACTLMYCADTCEDGHKVGESWPADDGCNTCTCTEDLNIACTKMLCPEDTCADGHKVGDIWAPDECNVCTCTEDLQIECTLAECPPPVCSDLEEAYASLVASGKDCSSTADCQVLWGQCGVGLGGCYEFVNQSVSQAQLDSMGQKYQQAGCTMAVCDCAPPPDPVCLNGQCTAKDPNLKTWKKVEGTVKEYGGFGGMYTEYTLKDLTLHVISLYGEEICAVPVAADDAAALLPAAEAVDWSGVAASYLPPNNPGCCCDQFFTELDLTLTALNGTVTTVSTKWCDEAIMLKMVPKPLQEFEEAFDKVCSAAALQCTSQPQPL